MIHSTSTLQYVFVAVDTVALKPQPSNLRDIYVQPIRNGHGCFWPIVSCRGRGVSEYGWGVLCVPVLRRAVFSQSERLNMARLGVLVLLPLLVQHALSISFFLPVRTRKCLKEEIHKDVLVTGEYEISEQPNTKTNLKVRELMLMLAFRGDACLLSAFMLN